MCFIVCCLLGDCGWRLFVARGVFSVCRVVGCAWFVELLRYFPLFIFIVVLLLRLASRWLFVVYVRCLIVCGCWLCGVRCLLIVVCGLVVTGGRLLVFVWVLVVWLFGVCCSLRIDRCLSFVVCCVSFYACF